jgi:oxygen-independent coproporphyrinogen III oxidase
MTNSLTQMPTLSPETTGRSSLNLDLVRKYAVPGPRYTSYPTALQFDDTVDRQMLIEDIRAGQDRLDPLSLYFHLPFCESACWFCGCTKLITQERGAADRYLDYLEKELHLTAQLINPRRKVVQMHFGGGTPTFLSPAQLRRMGQIIHRYFTFSPDAECGVEIDPRRLTREHIAALRDIGCNRASLGVQDNNPVVQEAINRIQPPEQTTRAIRWLREEAFSSINIDLIYGLPHQTVETFAQTLEEVCNLNPDRFAIFSYAHVPWIKPAQKIFDRAGNLPDAETKLAILQKVTDVLTERGYVYIGMDHFAKANDELARAQREGTLQRNFQGYSTKSGTDIYGFGMSSISQTRNAYRQNEKDLPSYYAALDKGELPLSKGYVLTRDDQVRRQTIMRLMCDLHLDFGKMSDLLDVNFAEYFADEIEALRAFEEDGLVEVGEQSVHVTPAGRFLIRNLAMKFDAYIQEKENRFSKTV